MKPFKQVPIFRYLISKCCFKTWWLQRGMWNQVWLEYVMWHVCLEAISPRFIGRNPFSKTLHSENTSKKSSSLLSRPKSFICWSKSEGNSTPFASHTPPQQTKQWPTINCSSLVTNPIWIVQIIQGDKIWQWRPFKSCLQGYSLVRWWTWGGISSGIKT